MNQILRLVLVLVCLNLLPFSRVSAVAAEGDVQWSWETQVRTKYLGKIGMVFYDDPIMVNDLGVAYGDFYGGIWNSTALGGEKYNTTFGDEFDLYVGWSHTYDWVKVGVMAAYFAINDLGDFGNDIIVVEPEISFPKVPVFTPYLTVRRFNQVTSRSPEDGWFTWFGLRRAQSLDLEVGGKPLVLNFDTSAGYSDGVLARDPGFVCWRTVLGLPINVTKNLRLTPSVVFQVPIGGQQNHIRPYTRETEIVGTLSLRFSL